MFEIVITETKEVEKNVGGKWQAVGEIQKQSEYGDKTPYLAKEYGNTPDKLGMVEKESEIYRQKVENLDIGKVIMAVNEIRGGAK